MCVLSQRGDGTVVKTLAFYFRVPGSCLLLSEWLYIVYAFQLIDTFHCFRVLKERGEYHGVCQVLLKTLCMSASTREAPPARYTLATCEG